jgi:hypothetical protein
MSFILITGYGTGIAVVSAVKVTKAFFQKRTERESVTRNDFARQRICELREDILICGHGCGSWRRAPKKEMDFENTLW